jgi:acetoin utilization protein AcuB
MNSPEDQRIEEWMTSKPITISSSKTLPDAYWLMIENDIQRLLVVDDSQLVGVITMEDLRGFFQDEIIAINPLKVNVIFSQMPVAQLMSKDPVTISPDENVVDAAHAMLEYKISTLPVVENEKVVGIITESDLFRVLLALCRQLEDT